MSDSKLKRAPALAGCLVLFLAGCGGDVGSPFTFARVGTTPTGTWVAIEPTQCLTNAWEADWLAQHDNDNDYAAYPRDLSRPGLEPEELAIIADYYARQGVVTFAGATAPKYEVVCLACSCPQGHTMYLDVRASDVETMLAFGYRVEAPPKSGPVLTRLPG